MAQPARRSRAGAQAVNRLSSSDRARVIACLVEGMRQRATVRITGIAKKTVGRLASEIGAACERFADRVMRDLPWCDEIWSFVGCKERQKRSAGCH